MRTLFHRKALEASAGVLLVCGLLGVKGCALSFDDYPVGDLCAASEDAGFQPSTAPDPALRGCDAGMPATEDTSRGAAGAAGADGGSE